MAEVQITQEKEILKVVLSGELVLNNAATIKDEVKAQLAEECPKVLVDLAKLDFVDSSGLGVLISWFKAVNERKGTIVYCAFTPYVAKIVRIAKLDKIFLLADDEEQAKVLLLK